MSKPYVLQIKRLKWIIKNWALIRNDPATASNKFFKKFNIHLKQRVGLCKNCDLYSLLHKTVYKPMMKSFSKFSGSTDTHERLELAKHCLMYLRNLRKKELME